MRLPTVRAFYRAAQVPGQAAPYNVIHCKVYYPCAYGDSFDERNTGFVPADNEQAPFPVVIMMPGINVAHESYSWLAHALAGSGYVVLTYSWIAQEMADLISVTPGVTLSTLTQEHYGQQPSCPALPVLLGELEQINQNSLLSGLLDLDNVVLGGHSAGGTMALLNANPNWYPQIRGAFSYGAHTAGNVQLGWSEDSFLPLSDKLPLLLMGGSRDGVIAASGFRYGDNDGDDSSARIEATFDRAIAGNRGDRFLLIVKGANHFSFCKPADSATGRPFLDRKHKGSPRKIRAYIADTTLAFCDLACHTHPQALGHLNTLCHEDHPLASHVARV